LGGEVGDRVTIVCPSMRLLGQSALYYNEVVFACQPIF